ncbi:MAG: ABC transporter permease subunit [Actinobacteria bacterium]|nr:ABC transporter permease subunit [Actinomycetota bacterium]
MSGAVLGAEPTNVWQWLADSSTREITGPIPQNLWITLWHSLAAGAIAVAVAVPLALVLAHFRRAEVVSGWLVNLGRIIPTLTVLAVAVVISLRNGYGFEPWPIVFALTLLAVPPVFANTYTAVRQASPDAVASARAMGLTEVQIMARVELPLALPLVLTGVRVALTQLVATEALGAQFGGDGLGLYIRFGFAGQDLYQIQAGALLVAGAAMLVDLAMWAVARVAVPRGIRTGRSARRADVTVSSRRRSGGRAPAVS